MVNKIFKIVAAALTCPRCFYLEFYECWLSWIFKVPHHLIVFECPRSFSCQIEVFPAFEEHSATEVEKKNRLNSGVWYDVTSATKKHTF